MNSEIFKCLDENRLKTLEDKKKYILELLGYEDEAILKAKGIDLNETSNEILFTTVFKSIGKNGRVIFETLSENGFFDKFNESKKIPEVLVFDGKLQPIFSYSEFLLEKVYVETSLDTDGDGKRDLIEVFIRRPKETLKGMKVPAIYVANPYMMSCNEEIYNNMHSVDKNLKKFCEKKIRYEDIKVKECKSKYYCENERVSKGEAKTSLAQDENLDCITEWYKYFNSRGIASVFSAGLGTKGSEGINCTGSKEEKEWAIAVIEWLNGKRKAYTNLTDNIEIKAEWCSGKVAMCGKSYLGTLSIAAATTGVEGLRTIIPEAAISNWYNYYRVNGVVGAPLEWQGDDADLLTNYCRSREYSDDNIELKKRYKESISQMIEEEARENGNYNSFWDERNYLKDIKNIKASVFIVHGLNDWNVKTTHCKLLWDKLKKYNIPSKIILHQGDHIYIQNLKGFDFNDIMNRWLSYWLYDIQNDVMKVVPDVMVQSNLDSLVWEKSQNWPSKDYEDRVFGVDGERLVDNLKIKSLEKNDKRIGKFIDDIDTSGFIREIKNYEEWRDRLVLGEREKHRVIYKSEVLEEDTTISGDVKIEFSASSNRDRGILSAMLVEIGERRRLSVKQVVTEERKISLGRNAGTMDEVDFVLEENPSKYKVITRGHINIQNRKSSYYKSRVVPKSFHRYSFEMVPTQYTLKKGSRLGLIIYGSDVEITQRPFHKTVYFLDEGSVKLHLKIK